jgi:hypothetical protein
MQQTENDFDLNNNSIKAIWTRYTKSLKVDKVVKKGSLISMIVGDKSLDQNTYATFIKELSNVK